MSSALNGKCPTCDQTITQVGSSSVDIKVPFNPSLKGLSFFCPHCEATLGVQVDPASIKSDIINELLARLPRGRL